LLNSVHLIGNLGADPETRTTASGTVVCNLRIATTSTVKRGTEFVEETDWHRVVVFGKQAESCGRILRKGRQVSIVGRIKYGSYEKDGVKHYTTEVLADRVLFLGGARSDGGPVGPDGGSDDIPF